MAKETTDTYEAAHEAGYFGEPADRRDDEVYTAGAQIDREANIDNELPAEGENPARAETAATRRRDPGRQQAAAASRSQGKKED